MVAFILFILLSLALAAYSISEFWPFWRPGMREQITEDQAREHARPLSSAVDNVAPINPPRRGHAEQ